jgi:hypothetical protein
MNMLRPILENLSQSGPNCPAALQVQRLWSVISTDVGADYDNVLDLQADAAHDLLSERCQFYVVSVQ